nr:hypothetical protein CKAN_00693800 [Ipomoea batatas]
MSLDCWKGGSHDASEDFLSWTDCWSGGSHDASEDVLSWKLVNCEIRNDIEDFTWEQYSFRLDNNPGKLEHVGPGDAVPGLKSKDLPSDGAPENLRRCAEVDGAVGGLGVHALAEEAVVLHFLTDEAAGEADFLAADNNHSLTIEQLLRQDGCQTSQHMVPRIHHHSTSADSRSRHHFC